jgi:hypothetical protein
LKGNKIAGGNPENDRVENDFYATNPEAVKMLLEKYEIVGKNILEPCVGNGSIVDALKYFYGDQKDITCIDIIDRGYPETIIHDFLTYETNTKYDAIITNPPYSLASEFIYKSLELLKTKGVLIMFLKIQFLEGIKRKNLFKKYPPKYIYVFRKRMSTFNNGNKLNPKTNKPWVTTFCNAWFIWEKGSITEPIVRWL